MKLENRGNISEQPSVQSLLINEDLKPSRAFNLLGPDSCRGERLWEANCYSHPHVCAEKLFA